MRVRPEDWAPVAVQALEPAANTAVREKSNLLILAGPGAGKTELLAQKASYLFQTGACRHPKRILAISFKRDAATNLKERMNKRCEDESFRFDSLTFDAFAKSILDRFRVSLSEEFRPSQNYEIGLTHSEIGLLLESLNYDRRPEHQPLLNIVRSSGWTRTKLISSFEKSYLISYQLNDPGRNHEYILNWAADNLWRMLITGSNGRSKLSYQMISRLSQLIINSNPFIKRSIQETYSHVFLDEFQDTTMIQYSLLKSCFLSSQSQITSVGDGKQRIMLWAGALEDVFERFQTDFEAQKIFLKMNFRCAPRLVELQTVIARYLDASEDGQTPHLVDGGIIKRIDFEDSQQEAVELSAKVKRLIEEEHIAPEDICFLFKQKVIENSTLLISCMDEMGIKARVEDIYQELLKEEFVQMLITFTKYVFDLDVASRDEVLKLLVNDNLLIPEIRRIENSLRDFKINWLPSQDKLSVSIEYFEEFIDSVIDFLGHDRIFELSSHYNIENIEILKRNYINKFFEILCRSMNLENAIKEFLGLGVVKCMTIHKSKGLEFEVILFIGLEDGMFWNFATQTREDVNAFFVAVSRPINQLYITFCNHRNNRNQTRSSIALIYDFLNSPNIAFINRVGKR